MKSDAHLLILLLLLLMIDRSSQRQGLLDARYMRATCYFVGMQSDGRIWLVCCLLSTKTATRQQC